MTPAGFITARQLWLMIAFTMVVAGFSVWATEL